MTEDDNTAVGAILQTIASDIVTIKEGQARHATILEERCKNRNTRLEGLEEVMYGNGGVIPSGVKPRVGIMWWVFVIGVGLVTGVKAVGWIP